MLSGHDHPADAAMLHHVDVALWKDQVLRIDYGEIVLSVKNQIVHLSGYVVSASNEQRILRAIKQVPGILGVKNALFLDDRLTREVARVLGRIERTHDVKFFTGVRHGVVTLRGDIRGISLHSQAETCAASVPGVRGVLSRIRIAGLAQTPDDVRFLQPVIDSQIYFSDGSSGTVQQVIINPNNRLVVAMILQGSFSRAPGPPGSMRANGTPAAGKKIVIPVREIRYLTKRSGFLHSRSVDSASCEDFEPEAYISPKKSWNPPLPYQLENVLFPADLEETTCPTDEIPFHESVELPAETSLFRKQALPVSNADIALAG